MALLRSCCGQVYFMYEAPSLSCLTTGAARCRCCCVSNSYSDLSSEHPQQPIQNLLTIHAQAAVVVLICHPQFYSLDRLCCLLRETPLDVHIVIIDGGDWRGRYFGARPCCHTGVASQRTLPHDLRHLSADVSRHTPRTSTERPSHQ